MVGGGAGDDVVAVLVLLFVFVLLFLFLSFAGESGKDRSMRKPTRDDASVRTPHGPISTHQVGCLMTGIERASAAHWGIG